MVGSREIVACTRISMSGELRLFRRSAVGVGINEIMRQTGKSKIFVWRWQERFMQAGYDALLRDKTQPSEDQWGFWVSLSVS